MFTSRRAKSKSNKARKVPKAPGRCIDNSKNNNYKTFMNSKEDDERNSENNDEGVSSQSEVKETYKEIRLTKIQIKQIHSSFKLHIYFPFSSS